MSNIAEVKKTMNLSVKEKVGYALGDGAANIAWRGVTTFLFIYYTDIFGLNPAIVGLLFLIARFSDGISDIFMGIIGDRTNSKHGKFRPWILWTAIPLGIILSLLFTNPNLSTTGKIVYAYVTYILFTLIYTANNIPYGALMGVMTGDDKERTTLGSYRMVGAYAGGMIVQGLLLFLVTYFGNVNSNIKIDKLNNKKFSVEITAVDDIPNVNIKTADGIALFTWGYLENKEPTPSKNFAMKTGEKYKFIVTGEESLLEDDISIINQNKGYSKSIYLLSVFLVLFMLYTFYATKERVLPPKDQKSDLKKDFKDLISNKPWLVLLIVGLLFNIYNSIKQGIVIIYFTHYLNNQLLAASFMIVLMLASIAGAIITGPLGKRFGKKNVFIYALIFSGFFNALFFFCKSDDIVAIFGLGIMSDFFTAILPTLFFAMLGDVADYSEYKNGRRATGLIYSAGSFATKFGGGIAGAIIGFVLATYNYDGTIVVSTNESIPGIMMLMSWIPALVTLITAGVMVFYPLSQGKMDVITSELYTRRKNI